MHQTGGSTGPLMEREDIQLLTIVGVPVILGLYALAVTWALLFGGHDHVEYILNETNELIQCNVRSD
jgi:hypothetical protein